MHMIVVGCGRVGSTVALELIEDGHDVVVIDRRADSFQRLGSDFGGRTMTGVGFDRDVLVEAIQRIFIQHFGQAAGAGVVAGA